LGQELEHVLLQGARFVVGVAGMCEVAFFVWVDGEVVELVVVGFRLGDREGLALADALVAFARHRPELLVVVIAGELDEVLLAVNVDLGNDGLEVVGLLDRACPVQEVRDLVEGAGRRLVALADLVVGGEEDRLGRS
jgi:hypothetical protein